RQAQALLELRQPLVDVLRRAALLVEGVARVLLGHLQEALAAATLGREELAARTLFSRQLRAQLSEPLGDTVCAVGEHGHEDLVRDVARSDAPLTVVIPEERRDDLVVGDLHARVRQARDLDDPPLADIHDADLDEISFPVEPEHVLVAVADDHDALLLPHLAHRVELIPVDGGDLEIQVAARLPHALLELAGELVVAAAQEEVDRADLRAVQIPIHVVHTGRGAALDLVLDARAATAG